MTVPAGSVLGTVVDPDTDAASVASAVAVKSCGVRSFSMLEDPVYKPLVIVADAVAVVDELPEVFSVVRVIFSGLLPDTDPDTLLEEAVAMVPVTVLPHVFTNLYPDKTVPAVAVVLELVRG